MQVIKKNLKFKPVEDIIMNAEQSGVAKYKAKSKAPITVDNPIYHEDNRGKKNQKLIG